MYLRSIDLRNWKAYESARFEFPVPEGDKNVILIGGRNGFGKTSLFEAVVLGLFGRDGLPLVLRAGAALDDEAKARSFRDFLNRSLNGNALRSGRTSCRIELGFEDEYGEAIIIQRRWYFSESGEWLGGVNGEEVRITQGLARRPIAPPETEPDVLGWYRDWISIHFMPSHLAGFFLFDGEAAAIYAERDMKRQVLDGIEGLLGLTWFRKLAASLRQYASNRRSQVPSGVDKNIQTLETQIKDIESEISQAEKKLGDIEESLVQAENERDRLTRELAAYGTGSQAELKELYDDRKNCETEYERAFDRLLDLVGKDLPLALCGSLLRSRVIDRLHREAEREKWLAACEQGKPRVEAALRSVETQLHEIQPPLVPSQKGAVVGVVKKALNTLWYPPPENVAEDFRHPHAYGPLNQRIRDRLSGAANLTIEAVEKLLVALEKQSDAIRRLSQQIERIEISPKGVEEKKSRLREVNAKVQQLAQEKGKYSNLLASRRPELEQKRKELARLTAQLDHSEPHVRRSQRAEEIAAMIDDLIKDAWPLQRKALAEAMTAAIQDMAHRNDYLNRVEIAEDGEIKLLTREGRNLREFDLSAGEKQVFTQALLAALAEITGKQFPLLIDTPLGRLDEEHRLNVLQYLIRRKSQVILLSTDTEVVGSYLDAIRSKVLKCYLLESHQEGDLAFSRPKPGYFQ